jgi:hypothetical protein
MKLDSEVEYTFSYVYILDSWIQGDLVRVGEECHM